MTNNVYATDKIAHHPDVLEQLRSGAPTAPILVQFMPANVCNQACDFCSYGHWTSDVQNPPPAAWKNHQLFQERDVMPLEKMLETVDSFGTLGVKAVEITGGGEPTAYRHFDDLLNALKRIGVQVALVSNGVLLNQMRCVRLASIPFTWVRISIDAGNSDDYCRIRHVPASHWDRAWEAVRRLAWHRDNSGHPEAAVGVGFVVDRENWRGLYEACIIARDAGADNIRLSMAFTPDGLSRWPEGAIQSVHEQSDRAVRELTRPGFHVHDLTREREENVRTDWQKYPYCFWKDVGCVIGADQNVYACCSWAYNKMGLMGSIREQSFIQLWNGEGRAWRQAHDPRRDCRIRCLYEARNKQALQFMVDPEAERAARERGPVRHGDFI